jgi:hypothetical protein
MQKLQIAFYRFFRGGALAAASLACVAVAFSSGAAEARTVKIKASQRGVVYSLYGTEQTCTAGVPGRVAIRVPPVNGSAEVTRVPWKIPAGRNCQGQTVKATVVYYTPKSGFRGRDSITLDASLDMYVNGIGERSFGETLDIVVE